jgi:hypothetical protein
VSVDVAALTKTLEPVVEDRNDTRPAVHPPSTALNSTTSAPAIAATRRERTSTGMRATIPVYRIGQPVSQRRRMFLITAAAPQMMMTKTTTTPTM